MISHGGKLIVKKYTAIGAGTVIIPGSHIPTVGLPQFLSQTHINDVATDIIVGEDCWIGSGSYLLSHAKIGRGCVVAAGSIVTKEIPPYAVVAGSPAKIIASRFSIPQIIKHEAILYSPEERMKKETLEELFDKYYKDKRFLGTDDISETDLERLKKVKQDYQMRNFDES
jgi:serine acetyltransferase